MIKKWQEIIPQLTGSTPRKAYVYLPTMYYKEPQARFPVLYMFDGQNVFLDGDATYGKSWGMSDYLDYTDTRLIVAAVECNRSPDNQRLSEYAPYSFDDPEYGSFEGKGAVTMDWFIQSFKPKIDRMYRTLPDRDHTYIAGSSMGGLMSLYALIAYNKYFSKAGALSPSLGFNEEPLMDLIKSTRLQKNTQLYMDYGSEEFRYDKGSMTLYNKFCTKLIKKKVALTSRVVPKGDHSEASWEKQLPFLIHTLIY